VFRRRRAMRGEQIQTISRRHLYSERVKTPHYAWAKDGEVDFCRSVRLGRPATPRLYKSIEVASTRLTMSFLGDSRRLGSGRIAILWRGDEATRRSATPETSRFKAVFAALADVGVEAEPVVYEDDVLDAVRTQLATFEGVLVWVNPIHEGRNRASL